VRELKFRAWDKTEKKFIPMFGIVYYPEGIIFEIRTKIFVKLNNLGDAGWVYSNKDIKDIELEQFTGMTDKNKKPIYEGDIVRYGDTVHKVVFEHRNSTAYFGLVYSENETLPFGHYQDLRQIEVIGTVHDQKEEV